MGLAVPISGQVQISLLNIGSQLVWTDKDDHFQEKVGSTYQTENNYQQHTFPTVRIKYFDILILHCTLGVLWPLFGVSEYFWLELWKDQNLVSSLCLYLQPEYFLASS